MYINILAEYLNIQYLQKLFILNNWFEKMFYDVVKLKNLNLNYFYCVGVFVQLLMKN